MLRTEDGAGRPVFILAGPDMYGRLLLAPAGPGIRILLAPSGEVARPDDRAGWARATRLPIGAPVSLGVCPVDRAKEIIPCQTTETRSADGSSSVPTG